MRRSYWLLGIFFLLVMLTGMGRPPGPDVPSPALNFKATVVDNQDISTKLSKATWDGNTFFSGMRGRGTVTIMFAKVRKVSAVGSSDKNSLDFQITLKSGDIVAVTFDSDVRFMGETSFGTYRILAKNIKEIVFE